jgi:hypothetical protein
MSYSYNSRRVSDDNFERMGASNDNFYHRFYNMNIQFSDSQKRSLIVVIFNIAGLFLIIDTRSNQENGGEG